MNHDVENDVAIVWGARPRIVSMADLVVSDDAAAVSAVVVTALPAEGALWLRGDDGTIAAVAVGQRISRSAIDAGLLTYQPAAAATGDDSLSFMVATNAGLSDVALVMVLRHLATTTAGSAALTVSSTRSIGIATGGVLSVATDTSVKWNAASTAAVIDNRGIIENTAADGRAINASGVAGTRTLTLLNHGDAVIQAANDAFRINLDVALGTVTVDNHGLIQSMGSGQALDFDAVASARRGEVVVTNHADGVIRAADADAIRPGENGTVANAGLIYAGGTADERNDAIDFQAHGGFVENHAGGVISGQRHGITSDTYVNVVNDAGGVITGRNGSGVGSDGAGKVVNHGLIQGLYTGSGNGDGDGVDIDGYGEVDNDGTIVGAGAGGVDPDGGTNIADGVAITGGGYLYNHAGGVIRSDFVGVGAGGITLTNEGTISARIVTVLAANATILNKSGALLQGDLWAVLAGSGQLTLDNQGTIDSKQGISSTSVNRLTNSGSIVTQSAVSIGFGGQDDTLILKAGSSISGLVDGGDGQDLVILGDGADLQRTSSFETLDVLGAGRVVGANAFARIVVEQGGVLTVGDGGHAGTLKGTVALEGADIVFDRADATSFTGAIGGSGRIVKAGAGTLSLHGVAVATTVVVVRAGTLDLDGAALAAGQRVTFASAGTGSGAVLVLGAGLGGLGTVGGIAAGDRIVVAGHAHATAIAEDTVGIAWDDGTAATLHVAHDPWIRLSATEDGDGNLVLAATSMRPVATDATASGAESGGRIAVRLTGADPDGPVAAFTLGGSPVHGALYASATGDTALVAGDRVTAIGDAATVWFAPDPDWSGETGFSFTAWDGAFESAAASAWVTVTAINHAPRGADATLAVPVADGPLVLSAAAFGFADRDGDALAVVVVVSLPEAGQLLLAGAPVTVGQAIAAMDLAAGRLAFVAAEGASGLGYARLTFAVQDAGGTADGGHDTDPQPRMLTIDAIPPAGSFAIAPATATVAEGDDGTVAITFTVTRTGGTVGAASVPYAITFAGAHPADAADLADGQPLAGTVAFADGDGEAKLVTILVRGDAAVEPGETFAVVLGPPSAGLIGAAGSATATIRNDDTAYAIVDAHGPETGDPETGGIAFTVIRSGDASHAATLAWAVSPGTAQAVDFPGGMLPTGTVSFAPGATLATVVVPVRDDAAIEPDETFTLTLTNADGPATPLAQATGTILNDDLPSLSVMGTSVVEGDDGTRFLRFTVTASAPALGDVTFRYATVDGTATVAGHDYAVAGGLVTLAAGETAATILVAVGGDREIEPDETVTLVLSDPSGATIAAGTAIGTILNDDHAGTFSLAAAGGAAAEGAGAQVFTVVRSGGDAGAVTVGYAVTGSGAHPADAADFGGALPGGTLDFADGETVKTIVVPITDDAAREADETYVLTLTGTTADGIGTATAAGTILNDEPLPTLAIGGATVREGDDGTVALTYTVTLSAASDLAVTVDYATADGTATGPGDYALTGGTLTFAPGETTATITVLVAGDTAFEPDETVLVALSHPTNAAIAVPLGTGTIANDDAPPPVGVLSLAADVTAREGAGALVFTVRRTDGSAGAVSVDYAVVGTVTGGGAHPVDAADFAGAALPHGTVTLADGQTVATITVAIADDGAVEPDETLTLLLSNPTGGAMLGAGATALGTIVDDDTAYTIAAGRAGEDAGSVPMTVTRLGDVSQAATLHYAVTLGHDDAATVADFAGGVLPSGTVTFAAGSATATIAIAIAADAAIEPDETFTVTLSDGPAGQAIATATATGTIVNDDLPTLAIADAHVFEGDGGIAYLVFAVISSAAAPAGGITFRAVTADGTATAGRDYAALAGATWSIPAGETGTTVTVAVRGDAAFERNETLTVTLADPTGATIAPGGGVATGTILDDDPVPATATLLLTDFAGFTAAGIVPVPGAGQLDSGVWRVGGAVAVSTPPGDAALVLQPAGDGAGYVEARVRNDSGALATGFDVAFDWAYRNSGGRADLLSLSYSTDGVHFTAYEGASFATAATADAAIVASFAREGETASIDAMIADGGYLYLRWTAAAGGGAGDRDEVGIDNVAVVARLSGDAVATIGDVRIVEGDDGETLAVFTITRSSAVGEAGVDYATADGTAIAGRDYLAQAGHVAFAAGELTRTVSVVVRGDTRHEPDETFAVTLANPVGVVVPQPRATATIVNDDAGPVPIYDIQGAGQASAYAGLTVPTFGVVIALTSDGFYLQDAAGDGDDATSDGLFVLTGAAPGVAVGDAVTLSGTVVEARVGAGLSTLTELVAPTAITVVQASAALPAPVVIATDGVAGHRAPPTDAAAAGFYESLEGMLVTVQAPRVVADTVAATGITHVVASDGIGAAGLNARSGITVPPGGVEAGTIRVSSAAGGAAYAQGTTLDDVTGVLTDAGDGTGMGEPYRVDPVAAPSVRHDQPHPAREATALAGDGGHVSYAALAVVGLAAASDAGAAIAREVVVALGGPDVVAIHGDMGAVSARALIAAIIAAGGPHYLYVGTAPAADGAGGDRSGFLYDPARVSYLPGSMQVLAGDATAPVAAGFAFNGQVFTAIGLGSAGEMTLGVKAYVDGVLADDPGHLFVIGGDLSGRTGTAALAAAGLAGGFADLLQQLPAEERYGGYADGGYRLAGTVIVSAGLYAGSAIDVVHDGAGYTDGLSIAARDPVVALIGLARATGTATAVADAYATTAAAILRGTVLANDTGGAGTIAVAAVDGVAAHVGAAVRLASGALLTLRADGTFRYDPDGAFSSVAAGATATDGFGYTLANGTTATATVTVAGIATPAPDASGHINGTAGDDTIGGTTAADYFDLSAGGVDAVSGGAGADAFFFGAALTGADRIEGGSGTDQVAVRGDYTGAARLVLDPGTFSNVEVLVALPGYSYDIRLDPAVVGDAGRFTVFGTTLAAGNDLTVDGAAVNGPLTMYGGLGTDALTGGAGGDGFYFGPGRFGPDDVVHGGGGVDQLALDGHPDALRLDAAHADVEILALLKGPAGSPDSYGTITVDDSWVAAGETKTITAVTAFAGSYGPVATPLAIDASAERDGHLRLIGGTGDDTITGGGQADTIFGGEGADVLRGGDGADVFTYYDAAQSTGRGYDTLADFDYGADRIQISGQAHDSYAIVTSGRLDDATFDVDLQAAVGAQLVDGVAVFFNASSGSHAGETFLIVDANGVAGYQAGGDYVFHLASAPPATVPDFIIA